MNYAMRSPAGMLAAASLIATISGPIHAAETPAPATDAKEAPGAAPARSPWLLMPTFSTNPKLGNAFGGMAAYVTKFDPDSQASLFGLSGQYTDTDSAIVALLARTSFGADHHRLSAYIIAGKIKNDYDDF